MAPLSSAFQERLDHLERTRNQRLSLLQGEKELQASKARILASKLEGIRSMERRCLVLDQKIAFQSFKISALESEIETLDSRYLDELRKLRDLKSEVEEFEEVKKERETFYEAKGFEMEEFRRDVGKFVADSEVEVIELRNQVNQLKSSFIKLQGNNGTLSNSEIAAAETRKSELIAAKADLNRNLASNYQLRARLQHQLQNVFNAQSRGGRKRTDLR